MKLTKQQMVYEVLKNNPDEIMKPCIIVAKLLTMYPDEPPCLRSTVSNAAYRSTAKGLPIKAIVEVGFKYVTPTHSCQHPSSKEHICVLDMVPVRYCPHTPLDCLSCKDDCIYWKRTMVNGIDPDMSWSSLDAIVDRMTEITRTIEDPDDIFNGLEEGKNSKIGLATTITPEQRMFMNGITKSKFSELLPIVPKATVESVMHYIMSHKPVLVNTADITKHFKISCKQAITLLIEAGEKYPELDIKITVTAVAL